MTLGNGEKLSLNYILAGNWLKVAPWRQGGHELCVSANSFFVTALCWEIPIPSAEV